MNDQVKKAISSVFAILFFAIGVVNTFWGNDTFFGIFIILLSLIYFPMVSHLITGLTGFAIPGILKVIVGAGILWASLGVGELFDKIDRMLSSF